MFEIILKEAPKLSSYIFNFDEIKTALTVNLEKYRNLVVTDDAIKEAKTTRADLNKLKKQLSDTVIAVKKKHLEPFDAFKVQTDELIRLIDEPAKAIDEQVKTYEQKLKDEKLFEVIAIWESEKPSCVKIPFEQVFKEQWLNATVSIKKVREELTELSIKIVSDLQVIESFNSEDEFAIKETYLKRFDMSEAMREKARIEQRRIDEAERQQRLKAEIERKEALRIQQEEEPEPKPEPENIVNLETESRKQKEELIKALLVQIDQWNEDISILQAKINANNQRIKELEQELSPKDEVIGDIAIPF